MKFIVFLSSAPHIVKFYPAWIEMDLLQLPMKGGAYSFSGKYVLKTIDELKTDKKPLDGHNTDIDAILIVENEKLSAEERKKINDGNQQSIASFENVNDHIIGISWYAALKILHEYGIIYKTDSGDPEVLAVHIWNTSTDNKTQRFVKKFFNLSQSSENTSNISKNYAKSVLVSFIHGVHAYLLVSGVTTVPVKTVPSINETTPEERFEFITGYLESNEHKGADVANINRIWQALCNEVLNYKDSTSPTEILKDTEKLDAFINMTKDDGGNNAASIRSGEDLDNIAYLYGISGILLKFDEDE